MYSIAEALVLSEPTAVVPHKVGDPIMKGDIGTEAWEAPVTNAIWEERREGEGEDTLAAPLLGKAIGL